VSYAVLHCFTHCLRNVRNILLTLQKNNKYLSCNVSLWSCYKFSWLLLTIVPGKIILKLHVLVRHIRKIAKSYFMSVCPSAWNNSAPAGRIFIKFDIWVFFQNLFRKFKIRSTLARKTGTLQEDLCTFTISPWILLRMSNVSDRNCRENQSTHFVFSDFFPLKIAPFWNNAEKYGRVGQATDGNIIQRMRIACLIPMATNTRSEYAIRIAVPRQIGYANTPQCYLIGKLLTLLAVKISCVKNLDVAWDVIN
jgi:hypothetical protein